MISVQFVVVSDCLLTNWFNVPVTIFHRGSRRFGEYCHSPNISPFAFGCKANVRPRPFQLTGSECPLFPIAAVQIMEIWGYRGSAFGQKRSLIGCPEVVQTTARSLGSDRHFLLSKSRFYKPVAENHEPPGDVTNTIGAMHGVGSTTSASIFASPFCGSPSMTSAPLVVMTLAVTRLPPASMLKQLTIARKNGAGLIPMSGIIRPSTSTSNLPSRCRLRDRRSRPWRACRRVRGARPRGARAASGRR